MRTQNKSDKVYLQKHDAITARSYCDGMGSLWTLYFFTVKKSQPFTSKSDIKTFQLFLVCLFFVCFFVCYFVCVFVSSFVCFFVCLFPLAMIVRIVWIPEGSILILMFEFTRPCCTCVNMKLSSYAYQLDCCDLICLVRTLCMLWSCWFSQG